MIFGIENYTYFCKIIIANNFKSKLDNMRNTLIIGSILFFLLQSCTTPNYEKAIGNWIQTDKDGTWKDLQFTVIERLETEGITVADSIKILEEDRNLKIEEYKKIVAELNERIKKPKTRFTIFPFGNHSSPEEKLKKSNAILDSLESFSPSAKYANYNEADILLKKIKCKYSIVPSSIEPRQERTDVFYLSPDEKKCFGMIRPVKKRKSGIPDIF